MLKHSVAVVTGHLVRHNLIILGKKFQGLIQVFFLRRVQPEHPGEANNFHPSTSLHIVFFFTTVLVNTKHSTHKNQSPLVLKFVKDELSLFRFN